MTNEQIRQMVRDTFLTGFLSSGEGYNGEHPFSDFWAVTQPVGLRRLAKDGNERAQSLVQRAEAHAEIGVQALGRRTLYQPEFAPWDSLELSESDTRYVEDLDISDRARNSLRRAGIVTIGDMARFGPRGLMSIPMFGATQLEMVRVALVNLEREGLK